ncbi:MAG: hydrogenase expression/formation protein HypE [Candidatus Omnitrophota bacterium]|jgi:hydrogenase expression/formation protein HypE
MRPADKILLSHGSGGRLTHELIESLFVKKFNNNILKELSDSAVLDYKYKLAFTTDSFVVNPLFFSGGDIGKLAVCGTANDLVMQGAEPEYLSLALIMEEGFSYKELERIINSISLHARKAGVRIATGDTKVVEKGACDKIFINSSGIGRIISNRRLSVKNIAPGDTIIVTGDIARHGLAVLGRRKELGLGFNIKSDCAALNGLLIPVLRKTGAVKFMRDPTRGGLATTLNEVAGSSGLGVVIDEKSVPVSAAVKTACELLGMDPLYIANEGRAILVVKSKGVREVLGLLKKHPMGRNARIIGEITRKPIGKVVLNTILGTRRIVDMLVGEPLPRIC